MSKIKYINIINGLQSDYTRSHIGDIDISSIDRKDIRSLYYLFPLMERMVLEIYKSIPLSDVEQYKQGTMRTLNEIINKDLKNYLPSIVKEKLLDYYKQDGIRNTLLHVKDDSGMVNIEHYKLKFEDIEYILAELVLSLNKTANIKNKYSFGRVKYLK